MPVPPEPTLANLPRPERPVLQPRPRPVVQAGGALALALFVALLLDPDLPGRWARDAPLPSWAVLPAVGAADAFARAAGALGLDAPSRGVERAVERLRAH